LTIEGYDMPRRSRIVAEADRRHAPVHVGVQRGTAVVEQVPIDVDDPRWSFVVTTRATEDGELDFGGPYVHGRRGDRFCYLSWGTMDGGFEMFRRAKLHFADCDAETLQDALRDGVLSCRVQLSDRCGDPRCARVRPPAAEWSAGTAGTAG
jgi:hypothetical protein